MRHREIVKMTLRRTNRVVKPPFVLLESDDLTNLPERFVEPLKLAHAGNGYAWIADELKIPLGTVRSRIFRARLLILTMRAAQSVTL